jgi:hypothetical protein
LSIRSSGLCRYQVDRCRTGWSVDGSLVKQARNILEAEAIERHGPRGAAICGATKVIRG